MLLIDYIKKVKNWESALKKYNIKVKYNENKTLAIFNYEMGANFLNPLVRVSRGIIIDLLNMRVVCRPFDKFCNVGEEGEDNIHWDSAIVEEKIDGSIMKLFYYNYKWNLASNSCINADELFNSLFWEAAKNQNLNLDILNKENTYIFELVSPETQVVIHYTKPAIYHIGTRRNSDGIELIENIGIQKPKIYSLSNVEDCVEAANNLNNDKDYPEAEGFVVKDKYFNRVKIKSPLYVAVHHRVSCGVPNIYTVFDLIRSGEIKEYLAYFDNQREYLEKVEKYYEKFYNLMVEEFNKADIYFNTHGQNFALLNEYVQKENFVFKNIVFKYIRGNSIEKIWRDLRFKTYRDTIENIVKEGESINE